MSGESSSAEAGAAKGGPTARARNGQQRAERRGENRMQAAAAAASIDIEVVEMEAVIGKAAKQVGAQAQRARARNGQQHAKPQSDDGMKVSSMVKSITERPVQSQGPRRAAASIGSEVVEQDAGK